MFFESFLFLGGALSYTLLHDGLALGSRRYSNARAGLRTAQFHGIPIKIEIEAGDTKSGIGEDGKPWSHVYEFPYGEIPSSRALSDGDGVDVYLGPNPDSTLVFVVHQLRKNGQFDEDKVFLNFSSSGDAIRAYKNHGPSFGFGTMDTLTVDQFMHGYLASNRKI